jgi:hypothetical protein
MGTRTSDKQICHNPNLGLTTKARAYKVVGQEGSPGITPHAPGNVRKCEGMNPHTPKGASTLGVWVLVDFQVFRGRLQGSKLNGLRSSLYHWKALGTYMSKMGSYDPFEYLKHKLWPKEGAGVKLAVWLPTTTSQKSTRFPFVQVACDIPLKSFQWGIKFCVRPNLNQKFTCKVMGPQNHGSLNFGNFGTHIWESRDKMPCGCGPRGEAHNIL